MVWPKTKCINGESQSVIRVKLRNFPLEFGSIMLIRCNLIHLCYLCLVLWFSFIFSLFIQTWTDVCVCQCVGSWGLRTKARRIFKFHLICLLFCFQNTNLILASTFPPSPSPSTWWQQTGRNKTVFVVLSSSVQNSPAKYTLFSVQRKNYLRV